jgi:adenylosuccinate synthase
LQWGDEAKGKLVDLLTADYEVVVRYQGGANAGHTVVVGERVYKLHHIPSGILRPNVMNVVTGGVVINPPTILEEMDSLRAQGVTVGENLLLSDRAHVVFPWHLEEDRLLNQAAVDGENIGTTLRGIGPCYRDKVGRSLAIRLGDLCRGDLRARIARVAASKRRFLASLEDERRIELPADEAIFREYAEYAERLRPLIGDTTAYLLDAVEADRQVLFEGAQGSLLDIDHGTYPFVTSSNSSGVGVAAGSGVPGKFIRLVLGVVKSYGTRVGGGPFPTEQDNEQGAHIRERGKEFGTTTGRPRRCGWFDAVAARYAVRLGGIDLLSVMMLDVLSALRTIPVCVAYEIEGRLVDQFPSHVEDLRQARPVYEELPGWQEEITGVRRMQDLPVPARGYLERISQLVGRPVGVVSVGPDRAQTIFSEAGRQALGR